MKACTDAPLLLTSTTVQPSPDGTYTYDLLGFLIPHETIRREAARGEEALRSFDCQSSPWKAAFFHEWIIDFFVPLLRTHHTIEDSITLPYYLSLNVLAPERQTEDHVELTNRENKLKSACAALVKACQTADMELVKEKESLVKVRYHELVDKMLEHFAEEEEFWPHLLRQCGPVSTTFCPTSCTPVTPAFACFCLLSAPRHPAASPTLPTAVPTRSTPSA